MNATNSPQNLMHDAIRKRLGCAKYVLLDGGHREVRYKWLLERPNSWAGNLLDQLASEGLIKPIETPAASDIQVHMLCDRSHITAEFGCHEQPLSYQLSEETNSPDAISIHYIWNQKVRPRFYSEGVSRHVGRQP